MMRHFFCYLTALLTLLACSSILEEKENTIMDPSLEGKPVTITFSVPDVRIVPSTKSIENDPDASISSGKPYLDPEKLYLVVCGHSQSIKYIRKAKLVYKENGQPDTEVLDITDENLNYPFPNGEPEEGQEKEKITVYKFEVQLELSDQERTIHFLGNIDESQLNTGADAGQILPTLLSYEGKQAYWQKVYLENILPDENNTMYGDGSYKPHPDVVKSLQYIPLIRNYAKIQVTNKTDREDEVESSSKSYFILDSYAIINTPLRGSAVPHRSNVNNPFNFNSPDDSRLSGYEKCTFEVLNNTISYQGNLPVGIGFDFSIPTRDMFEAADPYQASNGRIIKYVKDDPDQGFYLYERGVPSSSMKPTFVIIRGGFSDSPDTEPDKYYYYRLDLMETKTVDHQAAYVYYPIFRNFRYNIEITRIASIGSDDPVAAANSTTIEDVSADISMKHLSDISNGRQRLVIEPFMSRTYTGPSESGYYYLLARFFNDVNSPVPNTLPAAVQVELLPMEDNLEDIIYLYDDYGNKIRSSDTRGFYPNARNEDGARVIRFDTNPANFSGTRTQIIRITGRDPRAAEEYPLYREVEISLQSKQEMTVECLNKFLALRRGAEQTVSITIPKNLPESMFPLEFIIEAEAGTLTPDNKKENNNLPVQSGISISNNEKYAGKHTFQFVRTLTLAEYQTPSEGDKFTFYSYFKSNQSKSATRVWVYNEFFEIGSDDFENNNSAPTRQFYVQATDEEKCYVMIDRANLEYNLQEEGWKTYNARQIIELDLGQKVAFKSIATIIDWNSDTKYRADNYDYFYCSKDESNIKKKDGKFKLGGNIASLIFGDNCESEETRYTSVSYSFINFFKNHVNMIDASDLELPMMTARSNCYKSMFEGCKNLERGPIELPATVMADYCYRNMFRSCEKLVVAPILPATTINKNCYQMMFHGCKSLKEIKMNSKTYTEGNFISNNNTDKSVPSKFWAYDVPADGIIWLNPTIKNSANYQMLIPEHWTVKEYPADKDWKNSADWQNN